MLFNKWKIIGELQLKGTVLRDFRPLFFALEIRTGYEQAKTVSQKRAEIVVDYTDFMWA